MALEYDERSGEVKGNYSIQDKKQPVMSFGEDEQGDVYFTTTFGTLHRFKAGRDAAE